MIICMKNEKMLSIMIFSYKLKMFFLVVKEYFMHDMKRKKKDNHRRKKYMDEILLEIADLTRE